MAASVTRYMGDFVVYIALFNLAGVAIFGWLLLILAPRLALTRWLARSTVFPAYLAVLYVAGIVPLLTARGLGIMRDFVSADGVLALLATPDVALVAWIHILVFDHLVGLIIYRDNMRERVVPLPAQSLILFLTLMFGPVGFLVYYVLRLARGRGPAVGEASPRAAV